MIDRTTIENPRTHYGAGRPATRAFIWQRMTGALNIAFTLFFAWFVLKLAGADRAQMVEVVRHPVVAVVLAALIINVCIHMRIGMREVIEDYISEGPRNHLANAANTWFAIVVPVLTILAIAKILFWG
jgi:succinate dehydrogenase / fumarate reductase membrane anchor subunit